MRMAKERGALRYGNDPATRFSNIVEKNPDMLMYSAMPTHQGQNKPLHATLPDSKTGDLSSAYVDRFSRPDFTSFETSPEVANFAAEQPRWSNFGVAHLMNSLKGSGASGALYPAIGEVMADEGRMLLPDFRLTVDNIPNRALKAIGTDLTREAPVFIPHEDQLTPLKMSVRDFAAMPGPERAAANFRVGQGMLEKRLLNNLDLRRWEIDNMPRAQKTNRLLKSLHVDPDEEDLGALTQMAVEDMPGVVSIMRQLAIPNIGVDTLKRMQALRHMQKGTEPPDDIIKGLFFKEGGLAKMSHALRHVA